MILGLVENYSELFGFETFVCPLETQSERIRNIFSNLINVFVDHSEVNPTPIQSTISIRPNSTPFRTKNSKYMIYSYNFVKYYLGSSILNLKLKLS